MFVRCLRFDVQDFLNFISLASRLKNYMMKKIFFLLFSFPLIAFSNAIIYGIIDQNIVTIDESTAEVVVIDSIQNYDLTDIHDALYLNDTIYFPNTPKPGTSKLYGYSLVSNETFLIGDIKLNGAIVSSCEGLELDPVSGLVFTAYGLSDPSTSNRIGYIDLQDASITAVSTLSLSSNSSQGFPTVADTDGFTYLGEDSLLIQDGYADGTDFFYLQPSTGNVTYLSTVSYLTGDMFVNGDSTVLTTNNSTGELISLNFLTGNSTVVGSAYSVGDFNNGFFNGMVSVECSTGNDAGVVTSLVNENLIDETKLLLFPNPAKNELYIDGENGDLIEVISLTGNVVFSYTKNQAGFEFVLIPNIESGSYLIVNQTSNKSTKLFVH